MCKKSTRVLSKFFISFCMVLMFLISCNLKANAATTGKLKIIGTMQTGATLTAELVDTNYTGTLKYSWGFDYGMIGIGMEGYQQKTYILQEHDFGHYIYCTATASDGTKFQTSQYYLVKGGSFDSGSTPTVKLPNAPQNVKATAGDKQVTLTWNAVSTATKYGVYFYSSNTDQITEIATTTSTSYTVTNLTNGAYYEFVVRAYNSAGWSTWVWIDAVDAIPKASDTVIITKQPLDYVANAGQNATFSVEATGANMSYQWQESTDGNTWSDLSGKNQSTLTFVAKTSDSLKKYRCIIKNSSSQAISNSVKLVVNSSFGITSQPSNQNVGEGSTVTFKVAANGNGLSYQWQKSTNNGSTWVNSASTGAKTNTLSMTAKYSFNGLKFRCIVTDALGDVVTSNAVTLNVYMQYPYFTQNPSDVTVDAGDTAKFVVAVQGYELKYQWQKSTDGGNTWVNSSSTGATTAVLSMATKTSFNNLKFRCVVTAANGQKITSNPATLKVNAVAPVITAAPKNVTVVAGKTATFAITATGNGLTYQWQKSTDGGNTWANSASTGAKTATLSMTAKANFNGYKFRCKVTDKGGNVVYSGIATLTVNAAISVSSQPKDVTVSAGQNATFSVAASGNGLTYQWQKSTDGGKTWVNSASTGAKTQTLSMVTKASFNGIKFRCKVSDTAGNVVYSNVVTLVVK